MGRALNRTLASTANRLFFRLWPSLRASFEPELENQSEPGFNRTGSFEPSWRDRKRAVRTHEAHFSGLAGETA
jgi:hypothetical protein